MPTGHSQTRPRLRNPQSLLKHAAAVSGDVKAKSEVSFDHKLSTPGDPKSILGSTLKAKANSDGEDVVTPMVEQVARAVMAEVSKKK